PDVPGTHRHHLDHDRRNNRPWNITRMEAGAHIRHHNSDNYGPDFDPDEHSESIRAALEALKQDPNWCQRYQLAQQERALRFWHDETYATIREEELARRQNPSEATREAHRQAMLRRYADPAERERQSDLMKLAWSKDEGSRRQRQAEIARVINLRP